MVQNKEVAIDAEYVYEYVVFWKEERNIGLKTWYKKTFFNLRDAKKFGKAHKNKNIPLKPYIVKIIEQRPNSKDDIVFEVVKQEDWAFKYPSLSRYIINYYKVYKV